MSQLSVVYILGLEFNEHEFNTKLAEVKEKSASSIQTSRSSGLSTSTVETLKKSVAVTDDSAKYNYLRTVDSSGRVKYVFPEVKCAVKAVVREGSLVTEARDGERVGLVLDRTCLYHEAGGQQSDQGLLKGEGWSLHCDTLMNSGGYLVHLGQLKTQGLVSLHRGKLVKGIYSYSPITKEDGSFLLFC